MAFYSNLTTFYGLPVVDYDPKTGLGDDPAATAWRIGWFRAGVESETQLVNRVRHLRKQPGADKVVAIVIGRWTIYGEEDSTKVVSALSAGAKKEMKDLRAIMFGDVTRDECEISWLSHGRIRGLLDFKKLEHLQIRGTNGMHFWSLGHKNLKTLIIESGGMSKELVKLIIEGDFPKLQRLDLWLGNKYYGATSTTNDLRPLLEGKVLPKLEHLGLKNAEYSDAIAASLLATESADADEIQIEGSTFVLTGKLNNIKRADAQKALAAKGAKIGKSVSKNTTYLVAGEKSGSKMEKAKALGVAVLTEADLLELLGQKAEKAVSDASSNILERLKVLDLSEGTLGDEGALALLKNPLVAKLDRLDLHRHFISEPLQKKLAAIEGVDVDLSDAHGADTPPDDRYVAVGE